MRIQIEKLSKNFSDTTVLDQINLDIREREFLGPFELPTHRPEIPIV